MGMNLSPNGLALQEQGMVSMSELDAIRGGGGGGELGGEGEVGGHRCPFFQKGILPFPGKPGGGAS